MRSSARSAQEGYFLNGIGDDWFDHNRSNLGKVDLVQKAFDALQEQGFTPKSVLEVGCANGWRLKRIREQYGAKVSGIDPSTKAILEGRAVLGDETSLHIGVASELPFAKDQFDVVLFGFCLCLCDPSDWQMVIAEANRVLTNRGILMIHDYYQDGDDLGVAVLPYQHTPPVPWYFYDWKKLWLSHPGYVLLCETHLPDETKSNLPEKVVVLQKLMPVPVVPAQ